MIIASPISAAWSFEISDAVDVVFLDRRQEMNRSVLDHARVHGGDEICAQAAPQRAIAQAI
jgi:hypothetical protein